MFLTIKLGFWNPRLFPAGSLNMGRSYQKRGIPILPVMSINCYHFFSFQSHTLCWTMKSKNTFKILNHKLLEKGKRVPLCQDFFCLKGWIAVAFLWHKQLSYNTFQRKKKMALGQNTVTTAFPHAWTFEQKNNINRLLDYLSPKKSRWYVCALNNL